MLGWPYTIHGIQTQICGMQGNTLSPLLTLKTKIGVYLFLFLNSQITPGCAQGLILDLCLEITLGEVKGTIWSFGDWIRVDFMQVKCPAHCPISPTPKTFFKKGKGAKISSGSQFCLSQNPPKNLFFYTCLTSMSFTKNTHFRKAMALEVKLPFISNSLGSNSHFIFN